MAPGRISAAALLVLAQHLNVDAFLTGTSVRSQARPSTTAPSMVASAPTGKPMTREMQRKQERLEQERIRKFVTPPETYANEPLSTSTHEHLIGEEMVKDDASASELADRCIAEAERLFASEEGWTKVLEEDGIFVETKDVSGPYLKSGVRVVRGLGAIKADADDFYNFQVRKRARERGAYTCMLHVGGAMGTGNRNTIWCAAGDAKDIFVVCVLCPGLRGDRYACWQRLANNSCESLILRVL